MAKSKIKSTPKDFFYYLLMMVTLYIGVISFVSLLFAYIDIAFPDQLSFYFAGSFSAVRSATAALVVSWPVFILMSWLIEKDIRLSKLKLELRPRKWLLYLTLFIAAIVIIIDLITLINNYLGGELTSRFFLKTVVVLVVTAGVFGYYLHEIKRLPITLFPKIAAWVSACIVLAAIIAGFFIAGTPQEQRRIRFDDQRISDLQNIQYQILDYYQRKGEIPMQLDDLRNDFTSFVVPVDPGSDEVYVYKRMNNLTFQLCATFETDSTQSSGKRVTRPVYSPYPTTENWDHSVGEYCFSREIDPDLYKPINKESIPVQAGPLL